MKKEDIAVLAQLLTGIKDAIEKIEDAQRNKDNEQLEGAKREILNFQRQIDSLL
jgi:hypothetical protein